MAGNKSFSLQFDDRRRTSEPPAVPPSSMVSYPGTRPGYETTAPAESPPRAEEDWRLLDAELMEEMMEKQKSNTGYRKMLVSEVLGRQFISLLRSTNCMEQIDMFKANLVPRPPTQTLSRSCGLFSTAVR